MKLTLATASFLVLCTAASAQTATPGTGRHADPACKAAVENVCPGVKPGQGRIKDCLKAHNTSLKQLCPQDAKHHAHVGTPAGNTATTTAPVAQPPVGQ